MIGILGSLLTLILGIDFASATSGEGAGDTGGGDDDGGDNGGNGGDDGGDNGGNGGDDGGDGSDGSDNGEAQRLIYLRCLVS